MEGQFTMRFHYSLACLKFNSNPRRKPVWLRWPVIWAMCDSLNVVTSFVSTIKSGMSGTAGGERFYLILNTVPSEPGLRKPVPLMVLPFAP